MNPKKLFSLTIILLALLLTSCVSLAEDITPPPGMQAAPVLENTPEPLPTAIPSGPQFPENTPDPNFGALTYAENCAACHGETGMGDGPKSGLLENPVAALGSLELARQATPSDWYIMVTQGNMPKFMPPFISLSDQQRWDVIAYALTLSTSAEELQQGQTLYLENCAECHDDGSAGAVDFSDQERMSQISANEMFAKISEGSDEMPAFGDLDEADRWALTNYVRSLSYTPFAMFADAGISEGEAKPQESGSQPETDADSAPENGGITEGLGDITVTVINTGDGDLPPNLEIILRGYESMTEVYTDTRILSGEPSVIFSDTPLPMGRIYFATIENENAAYGSGILEIDPETDLLDLEIAYYPPTADASILVVDRLHLFFDFIDEQTLEVYQLYIFSNPSNQILVPADEGEVVVSFVIPPEASNLSVEENMSMAFQKTDDGFGIVNVYPDPNPYQVVFSYQVPYDGKKLDIGVPIGMDANAVIVMAPANGFKVESDQLSDSGTRDFEGVVYNMLNGSNLKSGNTLDLALSGKPKAETNIFANVADSKNSLVIGLSGFGAILIGAGIYLWRRNQADDVLEDAEETEIEAGIETAEEIIDAIIALDDQYKTGGLPEGAYRARRAELKGKLKELVD